MVCPRCVMAVQRALEGLGLCVERVGLGEARIRGALTDEQRRAVEAALEGLGFSLVRDAQDVLVERIKQAVIDEVRAGRPAQQPFSVRLSRSLGMDYAALSRTFAAVEGRTIERYFLAQRIERVKELLDYGEHSVKEIAFQLGFSSVAHLSRQFKQITGVTPSGYKRPHPPTPSPRGEGEHARKGAEDNPDALPAERVGIDKV